MIIDLCDVVADKPPKPLPSSELSFILKARVGGAKIQQMSGMEHHEDLNHIIGFPFNSLLGAIHTAFSQHYDLVLRPDDVWLAIAQGFGLHVNKYSEVLRKHFVKHEGQLLLTVDRPDFVMDEDNDWVGVFKEFSDKIAEHVGQEKQSLICGRFSTTTDIDKAAYDVIAMSSMKSYFRYEVRTLCGIPRIHLLGMQEDWESIKDRVRVLGDYDEKEAPLKWWIDPLLEVIQEFINAFDGRINKKFWESIYKMGGGSGGPYVTGWVNVLFPYLDYMNFRTGREEIRAMTRGIEMWKAGRLGGMSEGPTADSFASGLSSAPFNWVYFDKTLKMQFLAGFTVTRWKEQEGRTLVYPEVGWVVSEAK